MTKILAGIQVHKNFEIFWEFLFFLTVKFAGQSLVQFRKTLSKSIGRGSVEKADSSKKPIGRKKWLV